MDMTILTRRLGKVVFLTINRPAEHNALNRVLLDELNQALDGAEADSAIRAVVLEGQPGTFCTGMDFGPMVSGEAPARAEIEEGARLYFRTLRRFASTSKIVVAKVDGKVQAGGVGLVAASDFAICSAVSTFRLSEALLGLLPINLMPFLVRRVGMQKAYWMTLTTQEVNAADARQFGLVDEVAPQVDSSLRRFLMRAERIPEDTVVATKELFAKLLPIPDGFEAMACERLAAMVDNPQNISRIQEFMREGLWQRP